MQGLQVPTWLGVLLVLAVPAGTVIGAWWGHRSAARTAATRDDARWARESEREDIRHQREQERLNSQREYDVKMTARAERFTAYTSFLGKYAAWRQALLAITDLHDNGNARAEVANSISECARALEGLNLLCSEEIHVYTSQILPEMLWISHRITGPREVTDFEEFEASLSTLDSHCDRIRDVARRDLLFSSGDS